MSGPCDRGGGDVVVEELPPLHHHHRELSRVLPLVAVDDLAPEHYSPTHADRETEIDDTLD